MKIKDVRTAPERRTFANAVAVIVVLALVSLTLDWYSGSDSGEIAISFVIFGAILIVAVLRFVGRSSHRDSGEKLWITALWHWVVGLVARLLPGGADPPAASTPAAPESASPPLDFRSRRAPDERFRRGTHD